MKRILIIILLLPYLLSAQNTFVPDNAFEQVLINLELDNMLDDSVLTAAVDTVVSLEIYGEDIYDLTGIEDFSALTYLSCSDNNLQSLNLNNNSFLYEVNCSYNQLTSLSLKNGSTNGIPLVSAYGNPNLLCIEVDNISSAEYNWWVDNGVSLELNCSSTNVFEINSNRSLIKVIDIFGRKVLNKTNQLLFYVYKDGSVEKRIFTDNYFDY